MSGSNKKITDKTVTETSYFNKKYAEKSCANALAYLTDEKRTIRLKDNKCKYCYYFRSDLVAGRAFTEWNCGVCNLESRHPNTNAPQVCTPCSKEHKLCVSCGGDIQMREKRPATIKD